MQLGHFDHCFFSVNIICSRVSLVIPRVLVGGLLAIFQSGIVPDL